MPRAERPPARVIARLARGINLAGAFDRRDDGPGRPVSAADLAAIAEAGFTAVRVPVRWWGRTEDLLAPVADVVARAATHGLAVVLTMHHADAVYADPHGCVDELTAIWRRIAAHFAGWRGPLAFDLLNEPRAPMTAADWNGMLPAVMAGLREVDRTRPVVVGGAEASALPGLLRLEPPPDDHLIATLHYYEPLRFTHQGAAWEPGSCAWIGTGWGTDADRAAVTADLEHAAAWARRRGVPLYVGEFGTLDTAALDARVRWTGWVRSELDRLGLPWAYWDFATDFGAYDGDQRAWRPELLDALMPAGRSGAARPRA